MDGKKNKKQQKTSAKHIHYCLIGGCVNKTGIFTSIYKRRKLPQRVPGQSPGRKWILCIFEVRKKISGTPFSVSTGSVTAF